MLIDTKGVSSPDAFGLGEALCFIVILIASKRSTGIEDGLSDLQHSFE